MHFWKRTRLLLVAGLGMALVACGEPTIDNSSFEDFAKSYAEIKQEAKEKGLERPLDKTIRAYVMNHVLINNVIAKPCGDGSVVGDVDLRKAPGGGYGYRSRSGSRMNKVIADHVNEVMEDPAMLRPVVGSLLEGKTAEEIVAMHDVFKYERKVADAYKKLAKLSPGEWNLPATLACASGNISDEIKAMVRDKLKDDDEIDGFLNPAAALIAWERYFLEHEGVYGGKVEILESREERDSNGEPFVSVKLRLSQKHDPSLFPNGKVFNIFDNSGYFKLAFVPDEAIETGKMPEWAAVKESPVLVNPEAVRLLTVDLPYLSFEPKRKGDLVYADVEFTMKGTLDEHPVLRKGGSRIFLNSSYPGVHVRGMSIDIKLDKQEKRASVSGNPLQTGPLPFYLGMEDIMNGMPVTDENGSVEGFYQAATSRYSNIEENVAQFAKVIDQANRKRAEIGIEQTVEESYNIDPKLKEVRLPSVREIYELLRSVNGDPLKKEYERYLSMKKM